MREFSDKALTKGKELPHNLTGNINVLHVFSVIGRNGTFWYQRLIGIIFSSSF